MQTHQTDGWMKDKLGSVWGPALSTRLGKPALDVGPQRPQARIPVVRVGVIPIRLTSILQVMIPGSLPTALKALLRDIVSSWN